MDMSWQMRVGSNLTTAIGTNELDEAEKERILASFAPAHPTIERDEVERYPVPLRLAIIVGSASLLWAIIIGIAKVLL